MPTIDEIKQAIDEIAPPELAADWDNSGVLVNCGGEVKSILVALDITGAVLKEAEDHGCQLIISHHPVIFRPLRKLGHEDIVFRMVRKRISAICAHTNLDAAAGGVNDILAVIFGLQEPVPFAEHGRLGRLREVTPAKKLAEVCSSRFSAHVRYVDAGKPVQRLAVFSGSGGGLIAEAVAAGADCVLTGEADHHDAIDAAEAGISLIVAGHFHTEFPVVPVIADKMLKRFPDVRVRISNRDRDPFSYLEPAQAAALVEAKPL